MGVGVFIEIEGVAVFCRVAVGEKCVGEGTGGSDGEQPVMNVRSVSRIIVRFAA